MAQPSSPFLAQPVETIVHILEFCGYKALTACAITCKHLERIIASHDNLQFTLALAAAGLVEDQTDSDRVLTATEKLARVREYMLCGARTGQLAQYLELRTNPHNEVRHQNGQFIMRPWPTQNMRFVGIRSARRSVQKRRLEDWPVDRKFSVEFDYVVDFEQDLLVGYPSVLGAMDHNGDMPSLLFLSLSTGLPHPLAIEGRAVLPIPAHFRGFGMNFVQICGRHMSFFRFRFEPISVNGQVRYERAHEIMDWQTGRTLSVIPHMGPVEIEPLDGHGMLIAQDAFLRAVTRSPDPNDEDQRLALQIMPIIPPKPSGSSAFVPGVGDRPRFGQNPQERLPTPYVYSFCLPKLDPCRFAVLHPGPQLDEPSFSLQGLPSDGNRLLAFRMWAQVETGSDSPSNADTDVYLFVHIDALLELARSMPGLPPTMLADIPWRMWQHCARLVVPPRLPHTGLAWEPAMWSSAMREGFFIIHDPSIENQPPLPMDLWGNPDYLKTVYGLDFHPRRARYVVQHMGSGTEPLLLGPVGSTQGTPIFADPNVSPGGLACTEFTLKYPHQVSQMQSQLPFGMTEDGVLFFGHTEHDNGNHQHIQILAAVPPRSDLWTRGAPRNDDP